MEVLASQSPVFRTFWKLKFSFQLLVAVAAVALSVRFLVNLAAGELLCIVVSLNSNNPNVTFNSLAGPAHATLAAYAAQVHLFSDKCCLCSSDNNI